MSIYHKLKKFLNLSFKNFSLFRDDSNNKDKNSLEDLSGALYSACAINNLKSIDEYTKKILSSPKKEYLGHIFNTAASISAWNDNLDAIKYFISSDALISSETVEYIDINPHATLVQFACNHNNVEILHYLITGVGVKYKLNIHDDNDKLFIHVCNNNQINVAKYLIFDQHMKKTTHISDYLLRFPNANIEKMFELRDLNESLVVELNSEQSYKRKSKL